MKTLDKEVEDLWLLLQNEKEFYKAVEDSYGLVPSVAYQYLVGLNEYSVAFGKVVENPAG